MSLVSYLFVIIFGFLAQCMVYDQNFRRGAGVIPQGVLPNKEVGGGGGAWTSHQVWRQNLGQGPAKFTKYKEKFVKFCHQKTQKFGKSPNFWVISEIQRAKFGVFVIYIFGGKI